MTEITITLAMAGLLLMMAVLLCMTVRLMRDALREYRLIEEDRRIYLSIGIVTGPLIGSQKGPLPLVASGQRA